MKLIIGGYDYTRFVIVGTDTVNDRDVPKETWTDGNGRKHKSGIIRKASGSVDILLRTKESVDAFRTLMDSGLEDGVTEVTTTMINTGKDKTFDAFIEAELVEDVFNERLSIAQFTMSIEEA